MQYIRFFLNHKKFISFGFLLTFFSSFGQTFLVSLYVPGIMKEFQFSSFLFGVIYGTATIMSGLTLAVVGKGIDHLDFRRYTLCAVVLLILSCLLIGISAHPLVLLLGLWGLRLSGQGLFTHISSTTMSKLFDKTRGMALSLSVLGYSAGEAFFPITVGLIIGALGWRVSMILSAGMVGLVMIPVVFFILGKGSQRFSINANEQSQAPAFSRKQLLTDKFFYVIAFNSFVLFSIITGLFFYQLILAQEKGWTVEWIALSFLGFALGRTVFSLISGKLIDFFSAAKIFPFYLIPFAVGVSILAIFRHPLIAPVYFVLIGISVGMSSTLHTAILAEAYGTRDLGGIRAVLAAVSVFSTALSPALFGFLLDRGFDFTFIGAGSAGLVFVAIVLSARMPFFIQKTNVYKGIV